jgi:peroxiredoxin family protein/rhodanese-related sulfurtransferase/TusA-related sulfurtransferase
VGSTGVAGKTLKKEGIPYLESTTHSASHAGYYPGAIPLSIKIMFAPESGKLYGAQVVGYDGTDKRLDMLATVIKNNGTIYDLIDIEHAYAPPYSSAKDPVNIAGYVAENILTGRMRPIYWRQIVASDRSDYFLIDVRTKDENALGTIHGAVNIPVDELRAHIDELPRDKKLVVFCAVGLRGHVASRILMQHGFSEVYNLSGGYKTYQTAVQKQSNEDIYANLSIGKDDTIYQKRADVNVLSLKVDACGLQCPGPILKLKKAFDEASVGDVVEVVATDPGFARDVQSWCKSTGNRLLSVETDKGIVTARAEKLAVREDAPSTINAKNKTFIVFSDDLDKALASFVLANGAAATGQKVTMFFTFWGLNVIKKANKPDVRKDLMGRMFGWMMPSNSRKLKLSKMHMGGMGSAMMRREMKRKGIDSLESLMQQAIDSGVEFIGCQMSMDVMGVKKEELLDNVSIGGVATYMERAENAGLNLFI